MPSLAPHSGLVGHTGFVGGNLLRAHDYAATYNSRNIDDIRGRHFDVLVCAGVQAVKWKANKEPEADWAGIERLLEALKEVTADRFVLMSTIDVYPSPVGVDEDTLVDFQNNHAYGRHRWLVEDFVRERFATHHVIRLPGLFGPGLKKNVIFDLLHHNCLDAIQPESSFQYYDLARLGGDVERVIAHGLPLVNFATEPVKTSLILERCAPDATVGQSAGPAGHYDFHTRHAALWGQPGPYLYDRDTVLGDIAAYMTAERARLSA